MSKRLRLRRQVDSSARYFTEYYQRPFALMQLDLVNQGYDSRLPHPIRKRYWGLVIPGEYRPVQARSFVIQYARSVEAEIAHFIKQHSIVYWLHIYRRLSPGAIGRQGDPETIYITRLTLEAAIQKYGSIEPCSGLVMSNTVPIERIFDGLLLSSELELEREGLKSSPPQLVLTNFGTQQLREFFDLERLAYELWQCGAMLRIISKGASIQIDESEECVYDLRDDTLDTLVRNYDERNGDSNLLSAKGVVNSFENPGRGVMLLQYNVNQIPFTAHFGFYKNVYKLDLSSPPESYPNFTWQPFFLQNFLVRHQPFADSFFQKYKVSLDAVVTVIAALNLSRHEWAQEKPISMVRLAQRGYRGPTQNANLKEALLSYKDEAREYLDIATPISDEQFLKAIDFWTLQEQNQAQISLSFPGPHYIFLPFGSEVLFADFAWITHRLLYLFVDLVIDNENFKAEFLETLVRKESAPLPHKPCKANDGTSKQIDAAFQIGHRLIVVECKAQGQSVAYFRGDAMAVPHRLKNIEAALTAVDDKAKWLASNPKGRNYDISHCTEILPIVVTPFNEYIPSLESRYWIKTGSPRVITPSTLNKALEDGSFTGEVLNLVRI